MKIKENIKIASFDLDDTLLYHGELSDYNKQALIDLHNCGVKVVINTGRGLRFIPESCKDYYVDYLIASNGAIIFDNNKKEKVQITTIDHKDVLTIYSLIKNQHAIKLMVDGATFTSWDLYPYYIYQVVSGKATYGTGKNSLFSFLSNFNVLLNLKKYVHNSHDVFKMECSCKASVDPSAIVSKINALTQAKAVIVKGKNIEVCSKQAGKGQSLIDLADLLHISHDSIAAFGDSGNDIDALKVAKYAIAVENATDTIKKVANIHIGLAKEDGVGKYIESILEK